jgi:hypothetical protein
MESTAVMVPMKVEYAPSWITWVAATTTCLRALGVECDQTDVAGFSGYAFHLCVNPTLCPSGPTMLSWDALSQGVRYLGRTAKLYYGGQCHCEGFKTDLTREHCSTAFELAKSEISAGRPCVMWGAYVPEFAAAVGYQGDSYIVKSFRECMNQDQPPIPFDEIDAPGGAYLLSFPNATNLSPLHADKYAASRAVEMWHTPGRTYAYGEAAYDSWIEALEARRADAGGNSYSAACYAEGRRFARDFYGRLAMRHAFADEKMELASRRYGHAADAMDEVAKLFPFSGAFGKPVDDDAAIKQAIPLLRDAQEAESQAVIHLTQILEMDWSQP